MVYKATVDGAVQIGEGVVFRIGAMTFTNTTMRFKAGDSIHTDTPCPELARAANWRKDDEKKEEKKESKGVE